MVFRWPLELTALSLGSRGVSRPALIEVAPRAAVLTLAALSHVGHPAHLALIDAALKGLVRQTPTTSLGEDSRIVTTSVAAPLLVAHELGVERLTLADLLLMPREPRVSSRADRAANGRPVCSPDSARLLLFAADAWHWVRAAERFEAPGCLGTQRVGLADQWMQVIAALPEGDEIEAQARAGRWPARIVAEVREPTGQVDRATHDLVARMRLSARGSRAGVQALSALADLPAALAVPIRERRSARATLTWRGLKIDVRLEPEADGSSTLHLLPPALDDADGLFEAMRDLAWETLPTLIGHPLPERRTEPIAHRLTADDGRMTTLDVGVSVVIGRNQVVFACWVGTDGRVMLKLFPPGGMRAQV